jgi:hypothetical protein
MTAQLVRTLNDGSAHYRQSTPLDGQLFVFYLHFNERDQNWYLSVHDENDSPIRGLVGRKLVQNYGVTLRTYTDDRPAGHLLVVSGSMDGDPGLRDLSKGTHLVYMPAADVRSPRTSEVARVIEE